MLTTIITSTQCELAHLSLAVRSFVLVAVPCLKLSISAVWDCAVVHWN